jgi:hypothetical protein
MPHLLFVQKLLGAPANLQPRGNNLQKAFPPQAEAGGKLLKRNESGQSSVTRTHFGVPRTT